MSDLVDKLEKAKAGWNYLWNLIEKEARKDKVKTEILSILYKYQVELDATKHKLQNIENKIINRDLSKEDKDLLSDALSMHISNFQAIAFSIENLLKDEIL